MKRIGFTLLVLLFVCSAFSTLGQRSAIAKELKLVVATYIPPSYKDVFIPYKRFVDYVNERGKGIVQLDFFHSGSLLKGKQLLPGLMQGTADIIMFADSYIMGTFPILGIIELPFIFKDTKTSYEKLRIGSPLFKFINKELGRKNFYMLSSYPVVPEFIWTKNKPIRKPGDLKGLRIRTAGRIEARVIKALGGASTTMPSAEAYEALSRGTVDGLLCYIGTVPARGLQEVLKYVTTGFFASYAPEIYMRRDSFDSLPPKVRKLLIEASKFYEKQMFKHAIPTWENESWPTIRKGGVKEIKLTKKELNRFRKKVKPVWDWWKKQLPKGVGAKAIKFATD